MADTIDPFTNLRDFCKSAMVLVGESKTPIQTFMNLRYELMSDLFPHGAFSVGEATPDFFDRTLTYLTTDEKPDPRFDYRGNYGKWLEKYKHA